MRDQNRGAPLGRADQCFRDSPLIGFVKRRSRLIQNQYFGISRTDDIWTTGASASWLLTRWFGLTLGYTFADQHSSGAERGPTFNDNRVVLSAVFQR